jgi:hypothetical protein
MNIISKEKIIAEFNKTNTCDSLDVRVDAVAVLLGIPAECVLHLVCGDGISVTAD